jgi:8-oxo-dGTP diphosphatase
VTFVSDENPAEYMCLFTSKDFSGEMIQCNEGQLEWVDKSEVTNLNLWEGDRLFLELLTRDVPFFSMKLVYKNGRLVEKMLDGKMMS